MSSWRFGACAAAAWAAMERWILRHPRVETAAQIDEAARQTERAEKREAAGEAMRVTSRRVMREMWPPRPGSRDAAPRSAAATEAKETP